MSPTDDLLTALAQPPRKALTFRVWLAEQPKARQAALDTAAADARWSNHALLKVLKDAGAPCSKDSLVPWRAEHGYTA